MKSFSNIVVGIDYSEASRSALKQAARIAGGEGSKLTAVHVVTPTEIEEYQSFFSVPTEEMLTSFRDSIEGMVEAELGSKALAHCEAVVGAPYHELVGRTKKGGCDLLVLGSADSGDAGDDVGFFATKCVRHSSVPVLLTRRQHHRPFGRVVACVDLSAAAGAVIEMAAKVAADDGAKLDVVHAVRPPWMRANHVLYDLQTVEDDGFKVQYRELLEEQLEATVQPYCDQAAVEIERHVLEHPNPSQAIVSFLKEHEIELAVVGRSGRTAKVIKHYLIGSTAERLIHRCPCSVLTVPCHDAKVWGGTVAR